MKKILVLSGGGAMGTTEASCLSSLKKQGLLDGIDLIIGSSVGAINGSLLASGKITAVQLSDMYKDMCVRVFSKKRKFFNLPPIYDRKNFELLFDIIVGADFLMKDLPTKLIVSSCDMTHQTMRFFKSYSPDDMYRSVMDCVLKSFAAPYYFGEIDDDHDQVKYGDGGMGVDNMPVTEAVAEMFSLGWDTDQVHFIIVGCGYVDESQDYNLNKGVGVADQLWSYMNPPDGGLSRMMSRNAQIGHIDMLSKHLSNLHYSYYDIKISKTEDGMDKLQYLDKYKEYGEIMAKKPLMSR